MALTLNPDIPLVWRTPHTLQFGVDRPAAVLENVSTAEERLIAALQNGVTESALRVIARQAGASPKLVDTLLARLYPLVNDSTVSPASSRRHAVVDGTGTTADTIHRLLADNGYEVHRNSDTGDDHTTIGSSPSPQATLAVIVAAYAVEPSRYLRWLRDDTDHLAVIFSDTSVTLTPVVSPGLSPCLRCSDLARCDNDPAWPIIATQLYTRSIPGETELLSCNVASKTVQKMLAHTTSSPRARGHRFDTRTQTWTSTLWSPHPECGCREPAVSPGLSMTM